MDGYLSIDLNLTPEENVLRLINEANKTNLILKDVKIGKPSAISLNEPSDASSAETTPQ